MEILNAMKSNSVELAAIRVFNWKLQEKDAEIQQLKESVAELKQLMSQLAKSQDFRQQTGTTNDKQ